MKIYFSFDGKAADGARKRPRFLLKKFPYGSNMGQKVNWAGFGFNSGQKEIPKNGGVEPFLGIYLVAGEGLEPTTSGL